MSNHYVDNKKLYAEMSLYIASYRAAKEAGVELPRVNNYVGSCISAIAEKLATARNFASYSFREDMVGDAKENCLRYLHNFDPQKTNNPFAYFTQIMYYAFLRRIDKEKKQAYIRYKSLENSMIMNNLVEMAPDDESHFQTFITSMDYSKMEALVDRFETQPNIKKAKKKGIEKFIEDEV